MQHTKDLTHFYHFLLTHFTPHFLLLLFSFSSHSSFFSLLPPMFKFNEISYTSITSSALHTLNLISTFFPSFNLMRSHSLLSSLPPYTPHASFPSPPFLILLSFLNCSFPFPFSLSYSPLLTLLSLPLSLSLSSPLPPPPNPPSLALP